MLLPLLINLSVSSINSAGLQFPKTLFIMKLSLLCSFVCFSTLFLSTVFAEGGFSETVVEPDANFLSYAFTQPETNLFFEKHEDFIETDKFKLPGYLRWKSLGEVSEVEQGKRSGDTIRAVVDDISTTVNTETPKTIIVFATHGIKGVAAMKFAISHMDGKSKNKIVVFHPAKHARISVSEAFNEDLEKELDKCNGLVTVLKTFEAINTFVTELMETKDFENTFILEGLSEIGFNKENNLYPEGAVIMDIFMKLIAKGCKGIAINDPVLHNIDFGLDGTTALKIVAKWTDFEEPVLTEHHSCTNLKDVPKPETVFNGELYTPFAVIFIGFVNPCYNALKTIENVKHIYLGGHFLDPKAIDKFLKIESIKNRCQGINSGLFPTYQEEKLFHKIK